MPRQVLHSTDVIVPLLFQKGKTVVPRGGRAQPAYNNVVTKSCMWTKTQPNGLCFCHNSAGGLSWVVCVGNFMAIWVVFLSVPFYETLSLD